MNKRLAYIIGVFLGDGSIDKKQNTFCLQVIDEDFADKTITSLQQESQNTVRKVLMSRKTNAHKNVFGVYLSDVTLCKYLIEITNNRKNLPVGFEKWETIFQKELISGLLDSEGYVAISRVHQYNKNEVFNMVIGIGAIDTWIYELHQFLQSQGVMVGVITRETLKSGKIFARFSFNKKSFIEHNLYFNIKRKQDRIEKYKLLFPGSTIKRSISITDETKSKMSSFAQTRKRVGGRFVKIDNDMI